jgi:hypothetical protein
VLQRRDVSWPHIGTVKSRWVGSADTRGYFCTPK